MLTAASQTCCLQVVSYKMELSSDVSFEQDREGSKLAAALNAHLPSQAGACSRLFAQCCFCCTVSLEEASLSCTLFSKQ